MKRWESMRKPRLGELNLGAMAGIAVGGIGGLFAVGIAPAIVYRDPAAIFGTRIISLICCVISGIGGWLIGGQLGPLVGSWFRSERAELIGGTLGGLVPVVVIALWGWYMVSGR
jgi:hypothetical protein